MQITGKTRLAGVIGWPIEHSMSPPMQNSAIVKLGLDWTYVAMPVAPEHLPQAVAGARALGYVGLNVTLPHKQAMLPLMDHVDPTAKLIGAVNTVHFTPEGTYGFNTDAVGYLRTVEIEGGFEFAGRNVLQVGTGGVGRAMAVGALQAGCQRLTLTNRTPERAFALAESLRAHFPSQTIEVTDSFEELEAACAMADLIANATSLGMKPEDPLPIPTDFLDPRHTVFDTVYVPSVTPLLMEAQLRGARPVGGLGMLARQGARSLFIWSGLQPDERLMLEVLQQFVYKR